MNPTMGGMPAMLIAASAAARPVSGMTLDRPPSTAASRVPVAWSTMPIIRNSAAL